MVSYLPPSYQELPAGRTHQAMMLIATVMEATLSLLEFCRSSHPARVTIAAVSPGPPCLTMPSIFVSNSPASRPSAPETAKQVTCYIG